ncbi:hypothetical protein Hanom_Chr03g00181061 [Helianthus anomalus]
MTIKNETECVQKLPHAGPGFRSCIRVRRTCGHARRTSSTKFYLRNSFLILYVESYLFSKHNIFFIIFSLCALFLKKPTLFLRLAPRLWARLMRLACACALRL